MKHFVNLSDISSEQLTDIIESAKELKASEYKHQSFARGKVLALLFFDPSLRTQSSFQVAAWQLGANVSVMQSGVNTWHIEHLPNAVMDGIAQEHIKDVMQVLGGYADAIGIRRFGFGGINDQPFFDAFFAEAQQFAPIPLINLESSVSHPCQSLADRLTWEEVHPNVEKRTIVLRWAPHPKPLPRAVPQSFVDMGVRSGQHVKVVCPPEFRFSPKYDAYFEQTAEEFGGSFCYTTDIPEDAHVIYVKSWHSLFHPENPHKDQELRHDYLGWTVNEKHLEASPEARLMHCLPVRRNVVATDAALDHSRSVIYQQAENRLHAQKALLNHIWSSF
jgi:N-acetylornithine carbamoyltransferase